ncbi:MAG TPA: hypothetical protein DDW50_15675, partial [Firmicutes bacterium]|nr:hypothetical protein [Bacillota bacterium]
MKNKKKIIFSFLSVSMFSVLFLLSNTWASENNATVYVDYGMTINTETPNLFGICHYPPENRISAVMPLIQNAGFNTIRYDFYYENIIPSSICPSLDYYKANTNNIQDPNSWNWSGLFWLTDAYNRGMRIMAISTYCPTWLSYSGTNTGVPKDWDVYQDIVKKVYQKYKSMITRVEMYNEIDYFLDLTNSPYSSKNVAITDMYYYAASAIRSIDSNAVIGGIAPAYYNEQQQYEELLSNSRLQPSSNLFNFFTYHSYCMTPPGGCNNYRDTCKDHGYPYTIP